MIWLSMALTIAVILYSAFHLLYQADVMWVVLPLVLLVSLIVLHRDARRRAFGVTSVIAILGVPLVAIGGLALRIGFDGPESLIVRLIMGLFLFAGLYFCLSRERTRDN